MRCCCCCYPPARGSVERRRQRRRWQGGGGGDDGAAAAAATAAAVDTACGGGGFARAAAGGGPSRLPPRQKDTCLDAGGGCGVSAAAADQGSIAVRKRGACARVVHVHRTSASRESLRSRGESLAKRVQRGKEPESSHPARWRGEQEQVNSLPGAQRVPGGLAGGAGWVGRWPSRGSPNYFSFTLPNWAYITNMRIFFHTSSSHCRATFLLS